MTFPEFIQSDIDYIIDKAHFTKEQREVFDLLLTDEYTDEGIYNKLNMGGKRYYKIKKQVLNKIERVL